MGTLRLLTVRGRLMLIIGLGIAIGCTIADQRALLVIGLVLAFLPLLSAIVVHRSQLRLTCERGASPATVEIGGTMLGQLNLTHRGRFTAGSVLLEDQVPPALGPRPRLFVDHGGQDWQRRAQYPLHGSHRGRFVTGPLRVRVADPFGLASLDHAFTTTTDILVTPKVYDLQPLTGSGTGGQTGDDRPHRVGVVGQDDVLIREYHHGDDVRRIHWRSTARRGSMMVRREEQAWDPSLTIVLDNRASAHVGQGTHSSFEWAVSMAASVGQRFLSDGYSVELYHGQGHLALSQLSGQREAMRQALMSGLTDLTLRAQPTLTTAISQLIAENHGHLVIAILGRHSVAEAVAMSRVRRGRSQGIAILLDVDSWDERTKARSARHATASESGESDPVAEVFTTQRWQVVRTSAAETVPQTWASVSAITKVTV